MILHPAGEVSAQPIILEDLPDDLGTSYSQLSTFRSCPQKWNYRYVQRLQKQSRDVKQLDAGSWWHAIRQVNSIERGLEAESLRDKPSTVRLPGEVSLKVMEPDLGDRLWDAMDAWWNELPGEVSEEWTSAYGDPFPTRMRDVNATWLDFWADDLRVQEPLATELFWRRPLEFEFRGQSVTLRLAGYVDEIIWDNERQAVIIQDHKTTAGQLKPQTTLEAFMDSQHQMYVWGAYPIMNSWTLPDTSNIILTFNRVRLGSPSTPRLNLDGSLSKAVTDFDLDTYNKWTGGPDGPGVPWGEQGQFYTRGERKGEAKFGVYQYDHELAAILDSPAVWSKWYQTTESPLNLNIVKAHLQSAVDTAKAQLDTQARIAETGEAARNFGYGCNHCDFVELCRAEMVGGVMDDFPLEQFGLSRRGKR